MSDSFQPTATWKVLKRRAELLQCVREFFVDLDFLEVETPLLSADTVVDRHLDPVPVTLAMDSARPNSGRRMWLQTSPEFCMKRMLAVHQRPIFQVCKAFRLGESGPLHNPEFTMVEWYRPGDDDVAGRELLSALCQRVLGCAPAEEVSYRDAFLRFFSVDPHEAHIEQLAGIARDIPALRDFVAADRDAWLDALFVERIQPRLGEDRPSILYDYPASQAALARTNTCANGREVALRFELFVNGIELANGYDELLDANVLRERMRMTNAQRVADGKPKLPDDNKLLSALESGLPSCSGCALGFDRLVMVATGAKRIEEVIPFPLPRA
ncbi:MAG: EF-P lysine aminoacylase EpmA [Pirellulales bacterium]|nr:EF-P lysine aminoacylase EpmA [Pirellulales bacterium]